MSRHPVRGGGQRVRGRAAARRVGGARRAARRARHPGADLRRPRPRVLQERADHAAGTRRSEEHTSELQSLMRISYAVFCLTKKNKTQTEISYICRTFNNIT